MNASTELKPFYKNAMQALQIQGRKEEKRKLTPVTVLVGGGQLASTVLPLKLASPSCCAGRGSQANNSQVYSSSPLRRGGRAWTTACCAAVAMAAPAMPRHAMLLVG